MAIYMKIEGIDGDAEQENHKKWTVLKNVDWDVTRLINSKAGNTRNRESSEPVVGEIVVTKESDISTVKLFQEACGGRSGKDVEIDFVTTDGQGGETFLKLTMSNTLISGYDIHASEDVSRPNETIRLNFTKIEVKYTPLDKNGDPEAPVISSYDIEANKLA